MRALVRLLRGTRKRFSMARLRQASTKYRIRVFFHVTLRFLINRVFCRLLNLWPSTETYDISRSHPNISMQSTSDQMEEPNFVLSPLPEAHLVAGAFSQNPFSRVHSPNDQYTVIHQNRPFFDSFSAERLSAQYYHTRAISSFFYIPTLHSSKHFLEHYSGDEILDTASRKVPFSEYLTPCVCAEFLSLCTFCLPFLRVRKSEGLRSLFIELEFSVHFIPSFAWRWTQNSYSIKSDKLNLKIVHFIIPRTKLTNPFDVPFHGAISGRWWDVRVLVWTIFGPFLRF